MRAERRLGSKPGTLKAMVEHRFLPVMPPEIVVYDSEEPCPYIEGNIARRPMRLPTRALLPEELDQRLEVGDRRAGMLFYTQACPSCRACEPMRIDTETFAPSTSQRRAFRKARELVRIEAGPPIVDDARVALFDRHQSVRGLRKHGRAFTEDDYVAFLVERPVDAFELRYFLPTEEGEELVGVAITDRGQDAWSAVYTYYEPELPQTYRSLSLGTFSVLVQLELARRANIRFVYLGLAIQENEHMRYKFAFLPHERRINGAWRAFSRSG